MFIVTHVELVCLKLEMRGFLVSLWSVSVLEMADTFLLLLGLDTILTLDKTLGTLDWNYGSGTIVKQTLTQEHKTSPGNELDLASKHFIKKPSEIYTKLSRALQYVMA